MNYIVGCFDAIISMGTVAADLGFVRPTITEDNVVIIKQGRHILQEMTVDTFVPNDTFVSPEKNVALITGPNGSGKSVYIKQVGVLVFLAHIGSYLPCEKAIIGLTDSIFTRISTIETVKSPESAFSCDLTQISRMLQMHTPRSLCLVDEFGKGTSPIDGIALLAVTIRHFMREKAKFFCVLHFTEIFAEDIININSEETSCISAFVMETYENENKNEEHDPYKSSLPLYTLGIGISPSSNGIPCAFSSGIPQKILKRAQEVKDSIISKKEIMPIKLSSHEERFSHSEIIGVQTLLSTDWRNASSREVDEIRRHFGV